MKTMPRRPPARRPRLAAPSPGATPAQAPAGPAASDIEWRDYFCDDRLKRLIDIALKNNRDLRVSVLNIEQARAQYQVRRADELPTVGIGATGLRQPSNTRGIPSTY